MLAQTRAAKGFAILSVFFLLFVLPIERLAARETNLVDLLSKNPLSSLTATLSIPALPSTVSPLVSN